MLVFGVNRRWSSQVRAAFSALGRRDNEWLKKWENKNIIVNRHDTWYVRYIITIDSLIDWLIHLFITHVRICVSVQHIIWLWHVMFSDLIKSCDSFITFAITRSLASGRSCRRCRWGRAFWLSWFYSMFPLPWENLFTSWTVVGRFSLSFFFFYPRSKSCAFSSSRAYWR